MNIRLYENKDKTDLLELIAKFRVGLAKLKGIEKKNRFKKQLKGFVK